MRYMDLERLIFDLDRLIDRVVLTGYRIENGKQYDIFFDPSQMEPLMNRYTELCELSRTIIKKMDHHQVD